MTAEELNRAIEEFEINMLEMTHDEKIDIIMDITKKRLEITGKGVYSIAELLIVLEQTRTGYVNLALLEQTRAGYVNQALCRIICNLLFIHDK